MGFLDEVKRRQAAERASEQPDPLLRPRSHPHSDRLQPKLDLLGQALGAFCRRLQVATPNVQVSYALRDFARLTGLRQTGYETRVDTDVRTVTLELRCIGSEALEFELGSREAADEALDFLIGNGLKCSYRSRADWCFKFTVQPDVPVRLEFGMHPSDPVLKLRTQNLRAIGPKVERIAPEAVGEEFVAELEKCILRKDNHFDKLCGNALTEDSRARLRARIEAHKMERHVEREESKATDAARPNRLMELLRRLSHPGPR
jgi:hypothetical protein